jgi:hypothetical protein
MPARSTAFRLPCFWILLVDMWFGFLDQGSSSRRASTDVENRRESKCKSRPTYTFLVGFASRFPVFEQWKILHALDSATTMIRFTDCTCEKRMARKYSTQIRGYETLFLNMTQDKEPTGCNLVIEFIIPPFIEGSTCFERHTSHHQELQLYLEPLVYIRM